MALLLAAQPIAVLLETQIKGLAGPEQTGPNVEDRWDWATKWSLPKREALGLLIPGLFGYRVDTPGGGEYWGAAGRDAVWDRYFAAGATGEPPKGIIRFTGGEGQCARSRSVIGASGRSPVCGGVSNSRRSRQAA